MSEQCLCMFLDSILALLETNNTDRAIRIIKNGIKRIDKGASEEPENSGKTND